MLENVVSIDENLTEWINLRNNSLEFDRAFSQLNCLPKDWLLFGAVFGVA